jgi:hypothetical protein
MKCQHYTTLAGVATGLTRWIMALVCGGISLQTLLIYTYKKLSGTGLGRLDVFLSITTPLPVNINLYQDNEDQSNDIHVRYIRRDG